MKVLLQLSEKTKKRKNTKVIENFQPSVENIPNKALIEDSIYYNHKLEDKNMNSWTLLLHVPPPQASRIACGAEASF